MQKNKRDTNEYGWTSLATCTWQTTAQCFYMYVVMYMYIRKFLSDYMYFVNRKI